MLFDECGELTEGPRMDDFPFRKGFIDKRSPHWFRGWPSKCFVLENKKLMYFKDERCRRPLGVLDFDLACFDIEPMFDYDPDEVFNVVRKNGRSCCGVGSVSRDQESVVFRVSPRGCSRLFELSCSRKEANRWIADLNETVKKSKSPQNSFIAGQNLWWKFDRISPSQIEEIAQSGDVFLFRTSSGVASLQRAFTRGFYDHVAVFLRFGKDKLYFLEATGDAGVMMVSWKEFMIQRWYKLYDHLAIRRVHFDRSSTNLKKLQVFAKSVLGKPYSLNPSKIIKSESTVANGELQDGPAVNAGESYFCSELVADAWKVLGILPADSVGARYLPADFAAKRRIRVEHGCKLDNELLVDFDIDPEYVDAYEQQTRELELRYGISSPEKKTDK